MTTINLRELYPWYTEDAFIEVSDEVAAFLEEDKRLQINYAQYIRDNKAFYSLDAGDGIEAEALNLPEQPDEALERMELERLLKKGTGTAHARAAAACPCVHSWWTVSVADRCKRKHHPACRASFRSQRAFPFEENFEKFRLRGL